MKGEGRLHARDGGVKMAFFLHIRALAHATAPFDGVVEPHGGLLRGTLRERDGRPCLRHGKRCARVLVMSRGPHAHLTSMLIITVARNTLNAARQRAALERPCKRVAGLLARAPLTGDCRCRAAVPGCGASLEVAAAQRPGCETPAGNTRKARPGTSAGAWRPA